MNRFDYRTAGIYNIRGVKSVETANIYMDFHILIPCIDDLKVCQRFLQVSEMEPSEHRDVSGLRPYLNGIGRII